MTDIDVVIQRWLVDGWKPRYLGTLRTKENECGIVFNSQQFAISLNKTGTNTISISTHTISKIQDKENKGSQSKSL